MGRRNNRHLATAAKYDEAGKQVGLKYLYDKTEIQLYCEELIKKRLNPKLRYTKANERGIKGY